MSRIVVDTISPRAVVLLLLLFGCDPLGSGRQVQEGVVMLVDGAGEVLCAAELGSYNGEVERLVRACLRICFSTPIRGSARAICAICLEALAAAVFSSTCREVIVSDFRRTE